MKGKLLLVTLFMMIFVWTVYLSAGSSEGRALFASKCGQCHKTGGSAAAFAPTKFAGAQWDRFFSRGKHAAKKDISGIINPDEMESIKNYLIDHAADSSQPEAAGLK